MPTPPPDTQFDVTLTFYGGTPGAVMVMLSSGPVGGSPDFYCSIFDETGVPGRYVEPYIGSVIQVVPGDVDPSAAEGFIVQVTHSPMDLDQHTIWVNRSSPVNDTFVGGDLIEEFERLDWADYTFVVSGTTDITASEGGSFSPFLIEVLGPPEISDLLTEVGLSDATYDIASFQGGLYLSSVESDLPSPFVGAKSLMELLDPNYAERRDGLWNYTQGVGAGLWDTGVSIKDGVVGIAGGAWYVVKNYNNFTVMFRLLEGGELILVEDQQRLSAAWGTIESIANLANQVIQMDAEVAYTLLAGDEESLNALAEDYRLALEFAVEILEELHAEFDEMPDYEAGRLAGRIAGEILLEAGVALATGATGNVALKSTTMTNVVTKLDNLPDATIPPAVKAKFDELLEFFAEMATTKMCFVAGTLIHTSTGLVPIEQIAPGDVVVSRDALTGNQSLREVRDTLVTHPDLLYHISYCVGGDAETHGDQTETVVGTGEHPFFVEDIADFVPARGLRIGDQLRLADGESAFVTDIEIERGPPGRRFTTYNFEVADWHTYFAGEHGVWVHNAGPPCQRAFGIIKKIKRDTPGISHWDAFVTALDKTNTPARRKTFDAVMPEVVDALMDAMYKDAVHQDGTVDLTMVKTWKEIQDFRFPSLDPPPDYIGKRLWHNDLQNHHTAPKEWTKELLKNMPPYDGYTDQQWDSLYEEIPGFLMDRMDHVGSKGTASFHTILKEWMAGVDANNADDIMSRIEQAYQEWNPDLGPDVWKVAQRWLQDKGVQVE